MLSYFHAFNSLKVWVSKYGDAFTSMHFLFHRPYLPLTILLDCTELMLTDRNFLSGKKQRRVSKFLMIIQLVVYYPAEILVISRAELFQTDVYSSTARLVKGISKEDGGNTDRFSRTPLNPCKCKVQELL